MTFFKKFLPTIYVDKIENIDFESLKKQGVKSLFFDLDNTVIAYDQHYIEGDTLNFLLDLEKDFKIVIVSNSPKKRVKPAAGQFQYVHFAKKPLKLGLKKAMRKVG